MPISYCQEQLVFYLSGGNVSYVLHISSENVLMNLYWGKRVPDESVKPCLKMYDAVATHDLTPNHLPYELPVSGTGWYGTPAIGIRNAQGNDVVSLHYVSHEIYAGKRTLPGLPATYVEQACEADSLDILLEDPLTKVQVNVTYSIYAESGAITRSLHIKNAGVEAVTLTDVMPASVPLFGHEYELIHLKGAWAKERNVIRLPVGEAEYRIDSKRGATGHEENPFMALCSPEATEHTGNVWSVNLVYSGSFQALTYVDNRCNTRLSIGMNPAVFAWHLNPGETFTSPEAVMVYSADGLNGMSQTYHKLYRTRLVRGIWRDQPRPVLVNNWEGTYFDFTQDKILEIARAGKELGLEMLVLDDGWFGTRNDGTSSLGDWVVNQQKLPVGLDSLAKEINALGMKFGLWFEPEMVSPNSDLYRAHPDWCLHVKGRPRTEGRNQLVLDLSRVEVQDHLIAAIERVLASAPIDYVKWDMNRNMTEAFSATQSPERQLETQHRYMLGLYRILETLLTDFPHLLFECCAGGGGRFDPGMLYYMPQTWTSDDTDAVERLFIQYGTSFVYPPSAMSAHVSASPNHQTGRNSSMKMRCDVALGGNFGFELDLSKLSAEDMVIAKYYVEKVKAVRHMTQQGTYTRLISPFKGDSAAWQYVSPEGDEAMLCVYRMQCRAYVPPMRVCMKGLDAEAQYIDDEGNIHRGAVLMNMGVWIELTKDFSSRILHYKKL